MTKYFVYELIDPRDNTTFYVGKGTRQRHKAHESEARTGNNSINKAKCEYIRELWESGHNVEYKLHPCVDEMAAFDLEQQLIERYGRRIKGTGNLFNVDAGGRDRWRPKTSNKIVYVYDFSGTLVHTFTTTRKAADHFCVDPSVVSSRARRTKTYNDKWVLSYVELDNDVVAEIIQTNRPAKRKVQQCDMQWNVIAEYESTYAAGRSVPGIREDAIYSTLREFQTGKRKSPQAGGFLWRYVD